MKRTTLCIALALCLLAPAASGCSLLGLGGSDDNPGVSIETPATPASNESSGEESMGRVTVPNVVAMDAQAAANLLSDAGLTAMIRWVRDSEPHRTVLSQSVATDAMLESGSYVRLLVSLGPTPTVPPPPYLVIARAIREAQEAAAAAAEDAADAGTTADPDPSPDPDPDPSPDPETQTQLEADSVPLPASPVTGQLFQSDPVLIFSMYLSAGQTFQISVDLGASTKDPDFELYIYDPLAEDLADSPVVSNTSGDYPRNITYTATTSGEFYIALVHNGTDPASGGDYELTWTLSQ